MNERNLQLKVFASFLIVFIFAALYAWGGMEMKWLRRYLAPAVLCGGCYWISRDWRFFVSLPLSFLSLSLGYGSDIEIWKIIKRGAFGLANGAVFSIRNLWQRYWIPAVFQILLLPAAYIAFGVYNPLPARVEEFTLGVLVAFIPVMSAFIKKD
jgi:hypothetical protein